MNASIKKNIEYMDKGELISLIRDAIEDLPAENIFELLIYKLDNDLLRQTIRELINDGFIKEEEQ